jgi:hypothetical protein
MSALYNNYRNSLLGTGNPQGYVSWGSDTIKVLLVDTGAYTLNLAHSARSQVSTGVVATSSALTGVTVGTIATGVVDANDLTYAGLSGESAEALIFFKDSGNPVSSMLLVLFDGIPQVVPNGTDVVVRWSASGIFAL